MDVFYINIILFFFSIYFYSHLKTSWEFSCRPRNPIGKVSRNPRRDISYNNLQTKLISSKEKLAKQSGFKQESALRKCNTTKVRGAVLFNYSLIWYSNYKSLQVKIDYDMYFV